MIASKGFLKLPNLNMLIKQKSPLLPKNLALVTFGKLLIVFSTKVNLLYLLFNGPEMLSSASDKAKLCAENLLRTLILMTQVSLYLFSLLELI